MTTQATKPLRICVIENGLVPDALAGRYESYPQMVAQWLGDALPEAQFISISAVQGDPLPAPDAFDGYVLTGSKFSVYEDIEWIHRLRAFVQSLGQQARPVFGICFGHQLMADAFGGKTARAEQGWGIGAQPYRYAVADVADGSALVFHQDQVVRLPPGATVAGGSDHCPFGALEYEFPALSVQYHPEFTPDYVRALAELYGGSTISEDLAQAALDSVNTQLVDNKRIATWVAGFFRQFCC